MPETPVYGLPLEATNDVPGKSLRSPGPILAEVVETELQRIDSSFVTLDSQFDALESSISDRVRTIATIDSGAGTNTTEFTSIPQTYRDLMIIWYGESDGTGEVDSLAIRFNGDGGTNYESRITRNTNTDTFSSDSGTFSVLRVGNVGTFRGAGCIYISNYTITGKYKLAHGMSVSRGNSGVAYTYNTNAGGRWTSTAAVNAIRIWPSGQLWDGTPHLKLIGIP